MEKRLKIFVFILLYFLCCSKSCKDDSIIIKHQEYEAEKAKDSIRHEFETDYLSEEARYAAEIKAIQKLNDLSDYLEIYSDRSMDSLFRDKAGEMIRVLFISEDVKLSFGDTGKRKTKPLSLGEFLEKGFGEDVDKAKVVFDSIFLLESLQKSAGELYSGKLKAYQTIIGYPLTDSIISPSTPVTIEFISSKRVKIIGKDTLKVWEVALGDMMPE